MVSTTEANIVTEKLEKLRLQQAELQDRQQVAQLLQEGQAVSASEITALGELLKIYEKPLLEMHHSDLDLLRVAGGVDHSAEADLILKAIHAGVAHHRKLQTMAADSKGGRKVGDLAEIQAAIEAGRGLAARLEARIQKLAE